jgi:hypothetical protein
MSELNDIKLNPHTLENSQSIYVEEEFNENSRLITNNSPKSKYKPSSRKESKTTVHYGRRQLLINEIEFLCLAISDLKKDFEKEENCGHLRRGCVWQALANSRRAVSFCSICSH